jgi:hypothetical protein
MTTTTETISDLFDAWQIERAKESRPARCAPRMWAWW